MESYFQEFLKFQIDFFLSIVEIVCRVAEGHPSFKSIGWKVKLLSTCIMNFNIENFLQMKFCLQFYFR
jgi:hypothetical protein